MRNTKNRDFSRFFVFNKQTILRMRNPFEQIDEAFGPMFTECVQLRAKSGSRKLEQSVRAAVFNDATAEEFSDSSLATECEYISVVADSKDVQVVKGLKVGDEIIRYETNQKTYLVQSCVYDAGMGYVIRARSIG